MGLLKITFIGTCSHFLGVVPFVPHRVVLPDASAFRFLRIDLPEQAHVSCFVMPHFPVMRAAANGTELPSARLTAGTAMISGNIFAGVQLRVANASSTGLSYTPAFFEQVPSITSFVSSYTPAQDVVVGRQAMCYFDLFSGTVTAATGEATSKRVVITIETDGAPVLQVTPFTTPAQTFPVEYGQPELDLLVANHGIDCKVLKESNFDFLLHYLTAAEGIPRALTRPTPGLSAHPGPFTLQELNDGLQKLQTLNFPNWFTNSCFNEDLLTWDTSAACSDTRYP
jgi:hypothetical protein